MKTPYSENHEKEYGIPTLDELGQDVTVCGEELFPGGEQEALRRLDEHMKRTVFQCYIRLFLILSLNQHKCNCLTHVFLLLSSFRDGCVTLRSPRPLQTLWAPAPLFSAHMSPLAACLHAPSGGGWRRSTRGWVSPPQYSFCGAIMHNCWSIMVMYTWNFLSVYYFYIWVMHVKAWLCLTAVCVLFLQKKHSDPPVSLHGQLLWREFFYTASLGIPNFNKMEGNPVCTQVDWDTNPEYLAAWREVSSLKKKVKGNNTLFIINNCCQLILYFPSGSDWFPLHWCHHDPAETGGLDPPPGQTRSRLFSHERRLMDQLGRGTEGLWLSLPCCKLG